MGLLQRARGRSSTDECVSLVLVRGACQSLGLISTEEEKPGSETTGGRQPRSLSSPCLPPFLPGAPEPMPPFSPPLSPVSWRPHHSSVKLSLTLYKSSHCVCIADKAKTLDTANRRRTRAFLSPVSECPHLSYPAATGLSCQRKGRKGALLCQSCGCPRIDVCSVAEESEGAKEAQSRAKGSKKVIPRSICCLSSNHSGPGSHWVCGCEGSPGVASTLASAAESWEVSSTGATQL